MTHIYLTRSDVKVGSSDGRLTVKHGDGSLLQDIPMSAVESLNVFGNPQISTQLVRECLSAGIPVGYYSEDGHYFGKLSSFGNLDPARQKMQMVLTDNEAFCLVWSKRIVAAKIINSMAVLGSMSDIYRFTEDDLGGLLHSLETLRYAENRDMVLGLEGNAAKSYFRCLSKLVIGEGFSFSGRSTRPPRDPVNAMLSYGYSLFHRSIIGAVERHGLHPYFGFMHKIKYGHAALVSDLIEEFRAPLVDRAVISLVNSGELSTSDFRQADGGAVYMSKSSMSRLTDLLSGEMNTKRRYFQQYGDGCLYAFHAMLDKKMCEVVDAIESSNPSAYRPAIWNVEDERA